MNRHLDNIDLPAFLQEYKDREFTDCLIRTAMDSGCKKYLYDIPSTPDRPK